VGKGISETFDEHEQDTARRAYEKEMMEGAKRTAKISKAEIEEALAAPPVPSAASLESPIAKGSRARRAVTIPRWVITLCVVTVIMLIAAAGTLGFYLSHRIARDLHTGNPPPR